MTNFSTKKCRLYAGCETFLRLIYVNKLSKTRIGDRDIIGYNVNFDIEFIDIALSKLQLEKLKNLVFDSFEIQNTLQALCFSGFGGYFHFVLKPKK